MTCAPVVAGAAEEGRDIVDRVTHSLEVFEDLVLDAEADRTLGQFFLDGLDQLDQCQRVGVEVVGEGVALADLGWLDLEDVGQPVTDQGEHLVTSDRVTFDMGFGRHGTPRGLRGGRWRFLGTGHRTQAV